MYRVQKGSLNPLASFGESSLPSMTSTLRSMFGACDYRKNNMLLAQNDLMDLLFYVGIHSYHKDYYYFGNKLLNFPS